ncbi:MAG TPA: hypothetical protein VFG64_18285 [Dongiaceae bacterium]|nr:hypothetical protein [Dongiaceae bacterium]
MAGDWLASRELLFGTALGYPGLHRVRRGEGGPHLPEVARTALDLDARSILPVTVELVSTIRERLRGKPVNARKGVTGRGQDARGLGRRPSMLFLPGAYPARRAAVQLVLPVTLEGSRRPASVCADMRADH